VTPAFFAGAIGRWLAPALLLVGVAAGVWYYGHTRFEAGEAKVWALWEKERRIVQRTYDQKVIEAARIEDEYDLIKWRHDEELKRRLAADFRAGELARRLRQHYASSGPVSEAPDTSFDPFGAGGGGVPPGEVDASLGDILGACQRDAIRLNGWIQWWEEVSATR
jgi:hypothetical protein